MILAQAVKHLLSCRSSVITTGATAYRVRTGIKSCKKCMAAVAAILNRLQPVYVTGTIRKEAVKIIRNFADKDSVPPKEQG